MRATALLLLLACGDDSKVYTWGEVAAELSDLYCGALADPCGYRVDVAGCAAHNAWHLCEPAMSCDVAVDEGAARPALDACAVSVASLAADECSWMRFYGWAPETCVAVLELDPGAQP